LNQVQKTYLSTNIGMSTTVSVYDRGFGHTRLQFLSPSRMRTVKKVWKKKKEKRIKKLGQVRDSPVRRKSKVDSWMVRYSLDERYSLSATPLTSRISFESFKTDRESGHSHMEVNLFEWEISGVSRGPDSFPFDPIDVSNAFLNIQILCFHLNRYYKFYI